MPVEPGDSDVEVHSESLPVPARVAVTCRKRDSVRAGLGLGG